MSDAGGGEQMLRWASEPLPLYGLAEWAGHRGVSGQAGFASVTVGGETRRVIMSAGVNHAGPGEQSVQVVSHRADRERSDRLHEWAPVNTLVIAAGRAPGLTDDERQSLRDEAERIRTDSAATPVNWETVKILVDGEPASLEVHRVLEGYWCAICRLTDVTLTLHSQGVSLVGLQLVRLDLQPPEIPPHVFTRRPQRERRFPDELLRVTAAAEDVNVDLIYEGYERLRGSALGRQVELRMDVPHSHAGATGEIDGKSVDVSWVVADNSESHPEQSANLRGTFDGQAVSIEGVFHLEPGWSFDHANIHGVVAGRSLEARIEAVDGGMGSSDTVAADGRIGDTTFTLYGTVNSGLTRAVIAGTVDGTDVHLRVDLGRGRTRKTRVSGLYQGPLELLVLAVGSALWFV